MRRKRISNERVQSNKHYNHEWLGASRHPISCDNRVKINIDKLMFLNKLNNPKDPNGIFTDYTHRGWWRRFIRVASKEWKLIREKEIKKERNSAYKTLIP